ncbi:hypothetical protein [Acidipropionibacterium acidipropionici]|uniref:hypothetical protein n=1 Tax=Acidipropionibacterium acidipropionici TaxID=1748 RepID=UPI00110B3F85|nr:hypothetical protein [Acidipropionibacterium acidipropionici]QCV95848.1 hypothetical protein FEZ30_11805 [Acidipropionibacterium acidipropionici]
MPTTQPITTMSLSDVARLAGVQRPVVSMWRRRPVRDTPFPSPQPDGRFLADDVVTYLRATGRGNNPEPELATDLTVTASPTADPADRADILSLLAARAILGGDALAGVDVEDLLDDVEALDPDDEWLFSEIEDADVDRLAPQADAIADNAFSTAEAYEELRSRTLSPGGLATDLVTTLSDITTALLGENGTLVDVDATASDIALSVTTDESRTATRVLVATSPAPAQGNTAVHRTTAATAPIRQCLRRYRVHGPAARTTDLLGDWDLTEGSVILARVAPSPGAAMATIDELTLHMDPTTTALVTGPASILIDELPPDQVGARDAFLRDGLVRAAVRLPRGLLSEGGGEHLALWLMGPGDPGHLWAGDLSGIGFGESTRQQLLDDVVAAARASHHGRRAFALLHRTDTTRLLARSLPLTALDVSPTDPFPVSVADDAARMADLLRELAAPMTDPFGDVRPQATGSGSAGSSTLGDLARNRLIQVLPGHRFEPLPPGQLRMWTADAVASRRPDAVDLMTLTARHPDVALTRPGDVVFTSAGSPHAVVDAEGGSAVAEPARVLRISPTASLSARAIASAINALAPTPGKGRWRSWTVPVVTGSRSDAEEALARVDSWEDQIRTRLDLLDELRRLATRSVTSGAVSFVDTHANPRDGKASDGS